MITMFLGNLAVLLIGVAGRLALALPASANHARIVQQDDIQDEYDYIIVGGGTAGLTVGDRLTESGECEFQNQWLSILDFRKRTNTVLQTLSWSLNMASIVSQLLLGKPTSC